MIFNYEDAPTLAIKILYFFLRALVFSLLGIVTAYLLFPSQTGIISVFLVSFSLLASFDYILETNRQEIWEEKRHAMRVNAKTLWSLVVIFFGIFLIYFTANLILPTETISQLFYKQLEGSTSNIRSMQFDTFDNIFNENIVFLFIFLFFSLFYRTGTIFVLAWNASVWGAIFGSVTKEILISAPVLFAVNFAKIFTAIGPYLLTEAMAYVLVSMSGLFLSKAASKYKFFSPPFNKVMTASFILFIISVLSLIAAANCEATLAPYLINLLFNAN